MAQYPHLLQVRVELETYKDINAYAKMNPDINESDVVRKLLRIAIDSFSRKTKRKKHGRAKKPADTARGH